MKNNTILINTIYNGDALELLKDVKKFPDRTVNLIITSPPYADKRKNSYKGVTADKYVEWFLPIAEQLKRILIDSGSFILNIKEHPHNGERETYVLELILELKKQGWLWIEEYCWYKKNCFPGKWPNRFRDSWERCLHFSKKREITMYQDAVKVPIGDWVQKRFKTMSKNDFVRYISKNNAHLGKNVSNWLNKKTVYPHNVLVFEEEHTLALRNVIEMAPSASKEDHSAMYPIELPSWFIRLFTKENDIILDPFLGSGTTAVAAMLHRRNYVAIELKKEYYKESLKNINEIKKIMQKQVELKIKK